MRRNAFTLIELLVVIAIIAILAAILFPVFAQAKAAAKGAQCLSNMKQMGTSMMLYLNDYDDRIPSATRGDDSDPNYVDGDWGKDLWMFHIRPYIGTNYPTNIQNSSSIYVCPMNATKQDMDTSSLDDYGYPRDYPTTAWGLQRDPDGVYRYYLSYAINEHLTDGQFPAIEGPNLSIWEDHAGSFLFVEGSQSELEGDELVSQFRNSAPRDRWTFRAWVGFQFPHRDGANFAYLDGHTKFKKVTFRNQDLRFNRNFVFPPGSTDSRNDCGPWTAPAGDDNPCPR